MGKAAKVECARAGIPQVDGLAEILPIIKIPLVANTRHKRTVLAV